MCLRYVKGKTTTYLSCPMDSFLVDFVDIVLNVQMFFLVFLVVLVVHSFFKTKLLVVLAFLGTAKNI